MKIVGISSSHVKRGTYYLLEKSLEAAKINGAETELIHLADYDLKICEGCNNCLRNKECIHDDVMDRLGKKLTRADGIIISSPSYFGSVTTYLKNFMDRSRYLKMDNHKLSDKFLGAIATSGLNQGGAQSTVESIYRFGLTHGMIVVGPVGRPETESNMVIGTAEMDDGWRKIEDDRKAIKLAQNLGQRLVKLAGMTNK